MSVTLPVEPFFKPSYRVLRCNPSTTVLVPMGKRKKGRKKRRGRKNEGKGKRNVNIHIVYRDASCLES